MRSAHSREQDFMAITAEVEVLHQQLKGKGLYTVPPTFPTTSDSKPGNNVHFQPIDPAQKSSVQTMDQSLLNSSLNLLDDSPRPQSSSSNGQIPCGQTTPQGSVCASNSHVPPTPYVNQTAVNQHIGTQPTRIPPRTSMGPTNLQPPTKTPPSQVLSGIQLQRLPFVDAPPAPIQDYSADNTDSPSMHVDAPLAPTQDYSADNTDSPSTRDFRSKSANRQGVKHTSSASSSTSMSTGKSGPICWNCGEAGHLKQNCPNPPYCLKCKQKGHLPMKCPLKGRGRRHPKCHKRHNRHHWTRGFPVSETNASTVEVTMHQVRVLQGRNLKPLQALQVTKCIMVAPVQVRLTVMLLFPLALRTASQLLQA